jgi:hypothetical protein
LLVLRTTETGNERPIVLTSPWPSRAQFLVRTGEKLSADSHIAALDLEIKYALSKSSTTEYRVDLDGAITVLTIDDRPTRTTRFGRPGSITKGVNFPAELSRFIISHRGSPNGPIVNVSPADNQMGPWILIGLVHPLGTVQASMKLGTLRDGLMLGTGSFNFDSAGIVRGVKFFGSVHTRFVQEVIDRSGGRFS